MTDFMKPKFSVAVGSEKFREGWERIFQKAEPIINERYKRDARCVMLEERYNGGQGKHVTNCTCEKPNER